MSMNLAFHHLGLLSGLREAAIRNLAAFGYRVGETVYDPQQNADLCMATHAGGQPDVELITPRKDNLELGRLLTRKGDFAYHMCFWTPNVDLAIADLERAAVRVHPMAPAKPAVLFSGRSVSFYLVEGLGLVELLETPDGSGGTTS